jgi:hypothetical protein
MGMGLGGGSPFGGTRGGSGLAQAWEAAFVGKNFFPLRVVSQNSSGKEITRMEATAVEKKSIPDSEFAPPDGFKKFDMGAMMRSSVPGR